ncbi:Aldehyde/histidinol dehydrogenase [Fusarium acuminatum]|uniref:L-glutamate gamma-semialdehyde dehydrogenase n=1 Tax=Fusarium acuminatum TaxID=5515 RepID=A0ABZ2X0C6_9HYPO
MASSVRALTSKGRLTPLCRIRASAPTISLQKRSNATTVPFRLPAARNEPNPTYTKNSPERAKVEAALKKLRSELPVKSEIIFNGVSQQIHANEDQVLPAEHATKFTNYPLASKEQVTAAIDAALKAKKGWEDTPFTVLAHREFAGLNFVGSSDVFRSIYGKIGQGIAEKRYRDFPRVVGETSGKNFHLVHPSADINNVVNHTIRGAFEYQGQKCSATSRAYVPESRAKEFFDLFQQKIKQITIGNPDKDFEAFMGPVIHGRSFEKIKKIIDESNKDPQVKLIAGGEYDGSVGYFVKPTVYQVDSPDHRLFNEEIFGPVLAVYVYKDSEFTPLLKNIDQNGGGLALTGAVFAQDRAALREAENALRYSAGNFYLNCKTTAALIGQQSFGGARSSGTNDRAGSPDMLRRFVSPRLIKEEFFEQNGFLYPSNTQ